MVDPMEMSEFEKERMERVRRNRERLMALEIPELAPEIGHSTHKPRKTPGHVARSARRRSLSPEVPLRRSSRVAGLEADRNQVEHEEGGKIIVTERRAVPQEPPERHIKGDVRLEDLESLEDWEARYVSGLLKACSKRTKREDALEAAPRSRDWLASCELQESDVLKVLPGSCVHLAFHPNNQTVVLAVADKHGNLSLWHHAADGLTETLLVDSGPDDPDAFDGVMRLGYHRQYISGLHWAGGAAPAQASLFSASYDGSLRCLDPQTGIAALVASSDDFEFSAMDVTADGRTVVLGTNRGELGVVDCRSRSRRKLAALEVHHRKVNTVSFDPLNQHMFATASTDTSIRVWDLRKLSRSRKAGAHPILEGSHRKGCQAAYFAPDGSHRLVSTSFDDTVTIWDADASRATKGATELHMKRAIKHDNNTGRWVIPFRAVWAPDADTILVGNMKRGVDVFRADTGKAAACLRSEFMTAIPSRNAVHPSLPILAAATSSGRIHMYR